MFRDYLIDHPESARAYARLKEELSRTFPDDRVAYTQAKTAFIQEVTAKAKDFYQP